MGRDIKRVHLSFDWPLKETWIGYLNPYWIHRKKCLSCDGSGQSSQAQEHINSECSTCLGEGGLWPTQAHKYLYEAWKKIEPPSGDGWQLWETTTEGSPVSPVFESADRLAAWATINATTFGSNQATFEEWMSMIDKDFVCHRQGNMMFI